MSTQPTRAKSSFPPVNARQLSTIVDRLVAFAVAYLLRFDDFDRSYSSAFAHPIVTQKHSFSSEEKVFADTYSLFPMRSAWKKALSSNLAASASINLRADRFAITTAAVCTPAVFTVEERDDVFHELDAELWANRGPKGLRKLVAMLASSGMGKSAFVDAYGEYLLRKEDAVRVIPVNISFNTTNFGPQCHSSHVISIASRMLLSYCVRDPNPRRLEEVMNILETICGDHHERSIFLVVDWIITDFKEQTGQDARIFVGIDELGKGSLTNGSRNAEEVLIQAVTGALDDGFMEFRISALFTALQIHGLMCETKASQRGIKYVALRLLSTEASMTLLRSFIPEGEHDEMVNKLARMAVGHPRSIQLIKTAYLEANTKGVINETSMENIANAAMENIAKDKLLSNDELKFVLIKPMLSTKEALEAGIADMISRGKIMVTLSDTAVVVGIPPLVIRRSILECTPDAIHITAATKSLLLKLLDVAGWLNVAQFGARNNGTGKPFEEFHMFAEMILRNLLKVPQLHGTATVSDFYPSFSGSMKSDVAKSTDTYPALDTERSLDNVIDLPEVMFPSQPQFDFLRKEHSFPKANRLMGKALCARNVVLKPTFQYQQGFDVLLCGQGAGGKALLEGLEMSFSNNDYWINHPSAFHKRMVKKLKAVAAMRLQMRSIGINIDKDMRQVFAFHAVLPSLVSVGKASAEPREFKSWKDYLHHICVNEVGEEQLLNVVLLDKTDVSRMYRGLDSLAMLLKYTYEDKVSGVTCFVCTPLIDLCLGA